MESHHSVVVPGSLDVPRRARLARLYVAIKAVTRRLVLAYGAIAWPLMVGCGDMARPAPSPTPTPTVVTTPQPAADLPAEQFVTTVTTQARAEASAHSSPTQEREHATEADAGSQGSEDLERCNGRRSGSNARAAITRSLDSIYDQEATISLVARANGGHYVVPPCALRQGHDTVASAEANAWMDIAISFRDEVRAASYEVRVTSQRAPRLGELQITGQNATRGETLRREPDGSFLIQAGSSLRYVFRAFARLAARDGGACCEDTKNTRIALSVSVRRTPLIETAVKAQGRTFEGTFQPYIIGGTPTNGFPAVGALLIGERLHCSGTLIAVRTILTAAHCLDGTFARDITKGRMKFRTGPNAFDRTASSATVNDYRVPKGEKGFRYGQPSRGPYQDDIGLAYLSTALQGTSPYPPHLVPPGLIQDQGLDFIGYGYTRVSGQLVGAGTKRQAPMSIRQLRDRYFFYGEPMKQTCSGDSGGPALLVAGESLLVAGITSGGDEQCQAGAIDTRVEAYAAWLNQPGWIRN